MRKSILFIAQDSSLYGANQSLINMLSSIRLEDIRITVVFPEHGPICDTFDQLKWNYHIIKFRTEFCNSKGIVNKYILQFIKYFFRIIVNKKAMIELRRLVDTFEIDIVHSNSSLVSIGEKLARCEKLRHIWHLREHIGIESSIHTFGGIEKYIKSIQNSDQIICITKKIAEYYHVEDKAIILHDAVRKYGNYKLSSSTGNYFLFCGSLDQNKGVETAIDVFTKISIQYPSLKLLIVGSGELHYERYLKQKVITLNLEGRIDFLGFRNDIDYLMSNAIALLMCSKYEGLGRVTVEAMLNCCIVIGFNNAGTKEIINHLSTGLLYENDEQLINCMINVVNEEFDLNVMRELAYNYACSNFLEPQFAKRLLTLYNLD